MQEPLKIYISYDTDDLEAAVELYTWMKAAGFSPWMRDEDVLPGEEISKRSTEAMEESDILLSLLSSSNVIHSGNFDDHFYLSNPLSSELSFFLEKETEDLLIVPILLRTVTIPEELVKYQSVDLSKNKDHALKRLILGIDRFQKQIARKRICSINKLEKPKKEFQNLVIEEIELENIRCFHDVKIKLFKKTSLFDGLCF